MRAQAQRPAQVTPAPQPLPTLGSERPPGTEGAGAAAISAPPRTCTLRFLFQAKTVDRRSPKEPAGWTPFLDSSVSSHQGHPWSSPPVASASQAERGGSPAGPGPGSPPTARHWEPGTNLSPVTGSILLRVSRSRMESNGTFRKNTLRRKNKPQGRLDSPAAPDSRGPDRGRQQL